MASRATRFHSHTAGESEDGRPANISLKTENSRINVNIQTIEGSVSVGNKNTITYHTSHSRRGDDSSSSETDSSDSDTDTFCDRHKIPKPGTVRDQMKYMKLPKQSTLVIQGGSQPIVLDRKGRPVNVTRQGNGTRRPAQQAPPPRSGGTAQPGRTTPQATPNTRTTAETTYTSGARHSSQGPYQAQVPPASAGRGHAPYSQSAFSGRNTSNTARPASQTPSTAQSRPYAATYTFMQTSQRTFIETVREPERPATSSRTSLEERNAQVDSVLRNLPEPYRVVDDSIIRMIVPHFGEGWRRVFRHLSVSDEDIDMTYQGLMPGNGISEVIHNLLLQWSRQHENPYVYVLAEAIVRAEQLQIIPHLKSAYLSSITQ
ncbi:hypothetical protein BaRGS_00032434 [Batillaria attramentaria]|uniref:Death domain-containing protein n=1 Tax=Batillaria attramentaria TaxID=370345 RepID=A0ABD0JMX6_9CAEN